MTQLEFYQQRIEAMQKRIDELEQESKEKDGYIFELLYNNVTPQYKDYIEKQYFLDK
jgi:ribulose 1,5-bisphosphate carboxylase large subunit-like protein